VYKEKKFKAIQSLKKIPRIILFKAGHEIHYNGIKNFTSFFQFLEKKFEMDTVKEIKSVEEAKQMKKDHKMFFVSQTNYC
jgi:hypothetical protein